MTRREKTLLTGLYLCLNKMTGMLPSNPYHSGPVVQAAYVSHEASAKLLNAVIAVRDGELDCADEWLDDACRVLNIVRPA